MKMRNEIQAVWAESHQTHDRGNRRLFIPVMLDFCFQCGFTYILVIKEGKGEAHREYISLCHFYEKVRGEGDIGPSYGGTCPFREI